MDDRRIEALASRCLQCTGLLADRHRVIVTYFTKDILQGQQLHELGLFVGSLRPMWRHVDCADPMMEKYAMRPDIHYCVRCRKALRELDAISPVMQVLDARAVNPSDPTDTGLALGDRIHFVHADCGNRDLLTDNTLLVKP